MERIIIAGGRDFTDKKLLCRTMDALTANFDKVIILSGHAGQSILVQTRNGNLEWKTIGADLLGEEWALSNWHTVEVYHPDYKTYSGKQAPIMRNEEMARNAQRLVAFWNGVSPGTSDMIQRARKHKLKVKIIRYDKE